MRTVKNLSPGPLRISLPGGKTLHLGPGKTASVRDSAAEHPALQKLCDSGELELGPVTPGGVAAEGYSTLGAHGAASSRR
jgi:hypothetical protein